MTDIRTLEYRIARRLLHRRETGGDRLDPRIAERLITLAAVGATLAVLGTCAPELLWALVAGAVVLALGTPGS